MYTSTLRISSLILLASLAHGAYAQTPPPAQAQITQNGPQTAASGPAAQRPVIVSGTVPDEATRQAILTKVRLLYGADRVVDQIGVGRVVAPPNWSENVQKLITEDLKKVANGEFDVSGNNLSINGNVSNDELRQQIPASMAVQLNPTYHIRNNLRVVAGDQNLLDKALANRTVEFESGSATLTPRGAQLLDEMLLAIHQVNNRRIKVIGHTDSSGSPRVNLKLSQDRADSVVRYFVDHGINRANLDSEGRGSAEPLFSNDTADGRARNRRIEFRIDK